MVAAHRWLVESDIAEPDLVILNGYSYGGYLTLQCMGTHPGAAGRRDRRCPCWVTSGGRWRGPERDARRLRHRALRHGQGGGSRRRASSRRRERTSIVPPHRCSSPPRRAIPARPFARSASSTTCERPAKRSSSRSSRAATASARSTGSRWSSRGWRSPSASLSGDALNRWLRPVESAEPDPAPQETTPYADEFSIYAGNANRPQERICRYLKTDLGAVEVFQFANENIFVRVMENVREQDVFSSSPPVGRSTTIAELLIMIDACRASAGYHRGSSRTTATAGPTRSDPCRESRSPRASSPTC